MLAICVGNVIEISNILTKCKAIKGKTKATATGLVIWPLKIEGQPKPNVATKVYLSVYGLILSFDIPPYSTFESKDLYTICEALVASRLKRLSVLNKEVLQFHFPFSILVYILGKCEDSMI